MYPSIVQEITHSAEGSEIPGYPGTCSSATPSSRGRRRRSPTADRDAALATLGDAASLSAMVQDRAQSAVRALG